VQSAQECSIETLQFERFWGAGVEKRTLRRKLVKIRVMVNGLEFEKIAL